MSMGIHEGFYNNFPAVRGTQSGRACYIAMCPLRLIPRLFVFNEEEVPVELRAQRTLNRSRIPDITSYLMDNPTNYTLSSLTASINGKVDFTPLLDTGPSQNLGILSISMEAQILINDGQHRRAAVVEAIKHEPELGHDNISVLFFIDNGLKRSQQMFTDLNKHAVRPSASISTLYDQREQISALARHLVDNVPLFRRFTELERSSISNRSVKLFTISSIKNASKALLGKSSRKDTISQEETERTVAFWTCVVENMPDWSDVLDKKASSSELREQYVHAHGVVLQALGQIGRDLLSQKPKTWHKPLEKLNNIDWARENVEWEGRAMVHGRISKARSNVLLTGNLIKQKLGLVLNEVEQQEERNYLS